MGRPHNAHLTPISPGLVERQRSPSRRGPAPSLQLPSSSSSCSSRRERQFSLSERACSFLGPAPPSSNPERAWGQGRRGRHSQWTVAIVPVRLLSDILRGKKSPALLPHHLPQATAPTWVSHFNPHPLSITGWVRPPPLPLCIPPSLLADFSNRLSPLWEGKVWVRGPVPPSLQDLSSPCPFCPERSGGWEGDWDWKEAQGQDHRGQRAWTELSDQG